MTVNILRGKAVTNMAKHRVGKLDVILQMVEDAWDLGIVKTEKEAEDLKERLCKVAFQSRTPKEERSEK